MGVRTVQIITDSLDGKDLPEDTKPITVSLGRKSWDLYLSDANLEKFYSAMDKFTKNEPEHTATAFSVSRKTSPEKGKRDPEMLREIRAWAQSEGITHNGKPLSDRGRIPNEVIAQWEQSH